MNTFKSLEKIYISKVSGKCKKSLNIENPVVQQWINKAIEYKLTSEDYKELLKIGNWKGQYPGLNYLCTIYIHPLTCVQGFAKKVYG